MQTQRSYTSREMRMSKSKRGQIGRRRVNEQICQRSARLCRTSRLKTTSVTTTSWRRGHRNLSSVTASGPAQSPTDRRTRASSGRDGDCRTQKPLARTGRVYCLLNQYSKTVNASPKVDWFAMQVDLLPRPSVHLFLVDTSCLSVTVRLVPPAG